MGTIDDGILRPWTLSQGEQRRRCRAPELSRSTTGRMVRCNGTQAAQGPAPSLFDMLTVLTSPCVAGSERVQQHGWQDGLTSTSRDKPRYELYLARAREPYHDCIRSRVCTNARMQPDTMDTHLYRVLVCMCALCERSREEALRRIWEPCCFLCEKKSFVQYAFLLYTVYVLHTFRSPLVLIMMRIMPSHHLTTDCTRRWCSGGERPAS